MKAAILKQPGVPEYGDREVPVATDPARVVDVALAGMNPIDVFLATQQGAGFPRVPGSEGVGLVDGRRVYFSAVAPHGSMAQKAVADGSRIYDLPDGVSDEMGVALGIGGLTSLLSLSDGGRLEKGETVLILGASGIVGQGAVQLARELGAGRVVAAARNTDVVADLGADAVVALGDGETPADLAARFRDACAGRLDVILDPLWGVPAIAALMAATGHARLVQIGHSAALSADLSPAFMRGKTTSIIGYSSSTASADTRRAAYARLCDLVAKGALVLPTRRVALSDPAAIWDDQKASPNVKLCIDVNA